VLAATYACDDADFLQDGNIFTTLEERPGRIRRPLRKLLIGTMGDGVVVCCDPAWEEWLRPLLADCTRDTAFWPDVVARIVPHVPEDLQLRGPALMHACDRESFRPAPGVEDEITILHDREIPDLYRYPGFDDALTYGADEPITDRIAAVAWQGGEVVGMAGASDDAETMWQIGVNVAPTHQGRGVGQALVSRLTEEVLRAGVLPYYSTTTTNVRSRAVAASLGYWPAWTELYVRKR
jgi:GNAT superfamily N-acetyltransferase